MRNNKKFLFIGIISLIMSYSPISAEIIETNEISTIQNHIDPDTFVLFTVSDTIYKPANALSDRKWRTYFSEKVNTTTSNLAVAESIIKETKNLILSECSKSLIETTTPKLIEDLQNQDTVVFGIAKKYRNTKDNIDMTTRNLLKVGVDLRKTQSRFELKDDHKETDSFLSEGLIFRNDKNIGSAVIDFLNTVPYIPSKIVMVDKSRKALEKVENVLASNGIPFEGFRYSRSDDRKANFDVTLGTIQFLYFISTDQMISDEEAKTIQQANPDVDYEQELVSYIMLRAIELANEKTKS